MDIKVRALFFHMFCVVKKLCEDKQTDLFQLSKARILTASVAASIMNNTNFTKSTYSTWSTYKSQ
jgi:hypothetical protein